MAGEVGFAKCPHYYINLIQKNGPKKEERGVKFVQKSVHKVYGRPFTKYDFGPILE